MKNCLFIIGICPRSGTNFLYNLLIRHPDCAPSIRGGQDNLLYKIHLLREYSKGTESYWKDHWGQSEPALKQSLSKGILDYLVPDEEEGKAKVHVTKTPHTFNLKTFFEFFPDCKLIITLRNGQDAIESGMRSFPWNYDDSCKMYKESADRILEFVKDNPDHPQLHVVKYETLVKEGSDALEQVLKFSDLDPERYDFKHLTDMPVYGSSNVKKKSGAEKVHWEPVKKDENFNPVGRSKDWSKWKHYRFNYWVGNRAKDLGYGLLHESKGPVYGLYNLGQDVYYFVFRVLRKIKIALGGK